MQSRGHAVAIALPGHGAERLCVVGSGEIRALQRDSGVSRSTGVPGLTLSVACRARFSRHTLTTTGTAYSLELLPFFLQELLSVFYGFSMYMPYGCSLSIHALYWCLPSLCVFTLWFSLYTYSYPFPESDRVCSINLFRHRLNSSSMPLAFTLNLSLAF